jgi:phosphoenolpyruvate carboxykinase (ATP)
MDINFEKLFKNLSKAELIEEIILNKEGFLSSNGAIICQTGKFTGRSPKDKFIVKNLENENINWNKNNNYITQNNFDSLFFDIKNFIKNKKIYQSYLYAGSLEERRISLSIITSLAWHNLFCKNLFIDEKENFTKKEDHYEIICIADFFANPKKHGTKNENFTLINFKEKIVLIGGTAYAGEIKKSVFTVFNYLMPTKFGDLPMHCAANTGKKNSDTALFFGLSGTGKTSLSSDEDRFLVGDDEHVWTDDKIFNIEGGCYAKTINLSKEKEKIIYDAINFGSILENVTFLNSERDINFADKSLTENTRAAYSLDKISNKISKNFVNFPKNIFFLSCDAYGVLPPISLLEQDQIEFYFVLGYTAKISGTENGIKNPIPTFSACFGEAFLPLDPVVYSKIFIEKIKKYKPNVWLINTGWVKGNFQNSQRIDISFTRKLINIALSEEIKKIKFIKEEYFNFSIPIFENISKKEEEFLFPSKIWKDKNLYEKNVTLLKESFDKKDFSKEL